jgi:hypothetical protein
MILFLTELMLMISPNIIKLHYLFFSLYNRIIHFNLLYIQLINLNIKFISLLINLFLLINHKSYYRLKQNTILLIR